MTESYREKEIKTIPVKTFQITYIYKGWDSFNQMRNYTRNGKVLFVYIQQGEGNSTPFQYSCLENPTDGGAW